MALCDLSNRNPNVMFELGLRQAFDKPVVLVQEVGTPTIFDITPLRYTEYHREMLYRQVIEDQEKITTAVIATREAIKNSKSINSIVKLLSLTHAASLTNISESDKDTALLQVIMAELSNIKADIARVRTSADRVLASPEIPKLLSRRDLDKRRADEIESAIVSMQLLLLDALAGNELPEQVLNVRIERTKQLIEEAVRRVYNKSEADRLQKFQETLAKVEQDYFALKEKSKSLESQSNN